MEKSQTTISEVQENKPVPIALNAFTEYLTPRERVAHKGYFGHVLVIGGNYGMAGAVRMAGEAAARIGAGLVSVATRKKHSAIVSAVRPELMCHGVEKSKELNSLFDRATVIIVGPGLGKSTWSKKLLMTALSVDLPMVVDADALNLLDKKIKPRDNWILTPHPGEAARLLDVSSEDIQENRIEAVLALQERWGGVVVLKGEGTLVASSQGEINICLAGNPGMASGGMGDVLSGMIGGLLAQQFPLEVAAKLGVYVHSTAADIIAARHGERGMLALDLLDEARHLVNMSFSS